MQKHEAHGSSETQITTGGTHQLKALVDLIGNDAFAMSFQSVRQYREALLDAAPAGQGESAQTHNGVGHGAPEDLWAKQEAELAASQHAPDMTTLVEALEKIAAFQPKDILCGSGWKEWNRAGEYAASIARDALAAHRKQGGEE